MFGVWYGLVWLSDWVMKQMTVYGVMVLVMVDGRFPPFTEDTNR